MRNPGYCFLCKGKSGIFGSEGAFQEHRTDSTFFDQEFINLRLRWNIIKDILGKKGVVSERRYEEALQLAPDLPAALERFGNLRLYQKRPAEAVVLFERLVASSRESPTSLMLYGRALAYAGRSAEARRALEKALAKDPRLAEARALLRDLPRGS